MRPIASMLRRLGNCGPETAAIGRSGMGKVMVNLQSPLNYLAISMIFGGMLISMIASVAGEIEDGALTNRRPFRAPHHSASMPALVGGGLRARPGEASLAHHGVLFLDELPEFQPQVLDSLRQPLEIGEVAIARAVAARVARARAMQEERYAATGLPQVRTNAGAHGPLLEEVARPDAGGLALLRDAADAMRLSARGYHRVLRVARTLADLDGTEKVGRVHLAEALSYRALVDEVRRAA